MPTVEITSHNAREIVDQIDNFLFDCDGVLWNNSEVIPGVPETLKWLRNLVCQGPGGYQCHQGKNIFFISNNSSSSRAQYMKKFDSFSIDCQINDIWCSSYITAEYLKSIGFDKKVYVVGMQGLADEINQAGIPCSCDVQTHNILIDSLTDATKHELDQSIGAIVVGIDVKINYNKVAYAHLHLFNRDHCLFIATNDDNTFPSQGGLVLPGGGCIVKMLEYCTERQAMITGKPNTWSLDLMVERYKLDRSRTAMFGDKIETDILYGNKGGIKTVLLLTGVTKIDKIIDDDRQNMESISDQVSLDQYLTSSDYDDNKIPHYYLNKLPDIMQYYHEKDGSNQL